MRCEIYHAEIPEKTCILRQKGSRSEYSRTFVSHDPNCRNCKQGKAVLAAYQNALGKKQKGKQS